MLTLGFADSKKNYKVAYTEHGARCFLINILFKAFDVDRREWPLIDALGLLRWARKAGSLAQGTWLSHRPQRRCKVSSSLNEVHWLKMSIRIMPKYKLHHQVDPSDHSSLCRSYRHLSVSPRPRCSRELRHRPGTLRLALRLLQEPWRRRQVAPWQARRHQPPGQVR